MEGILLHTKVPLGLIAKLIRINSLNRHACELQLDFDDFV